MGSSGSVQRGMPHKASNVSESATKPARKVTGFFYSISARLALCTPSQTTVARKAVRQLAILTAAVASLNEEAPRWPRRAASPISSQERLRRPRRGRESRFARGLCGKLAAAAPPRIARHRGWTEKRHGTEDGPRRLQAQLLERRRSDQLRRGRPKNHRRPGPGRRRLDPSDGSCGRSTNNTQRFGPARQARR